MMDVPTILNLRQKSTLDVHVLMPSRRTADHATGSFRRTQVTSHHATCDGSPGGSGPAKEGPRRTADGRSTAGSSVVP
jgi:hypothetical protein